MSVTFRNPDLAEMAAWITGVRRSGNTSADIVDEDPLRLFRKFVSVVLLTRGIAE
jgi:D-amino peptidase